MAPRDPVFAEPWQAQVLAMADALVRSGRITPDDWSSALGAALAAAEAGGAEDSETTYYLAALQAVEALALQNTALTASDLEGRKADWQDAYLSTPHGAPVVLSRERDTAG